LHKKYIFGNIFLNQSNLIFYQRRRRTRRRNTTVWRISPNIVGPLTPQVAALGPKIETKRELVSWYTTLDEMIAKRIAAIKAASHF
jgi:hypothetical protein